MGQLFSAFLRKSVMFRLGFLAGMIGILIGCGGGGDGFSGVGWRRKWGHSSSRQPEPNSNDFFPGRHVFQ